MRASCLLTYSAANGRTQCSGLSRVSAARCQHFEIWTEFWTPNMRIQSNCTAVAVRDEAKTFVTV